MHSGAAGKFSGAEKIAPQHCARVRAMECKQRGCTETCARVVAREGGENRLFELKLDGARHRHCYRCFTGFYRHGRIAR